MGLDMYLQGKYYLFDLEKKKIFREKTKEVLNLDLEADEIIFNLITWRKANAIHKWFVDNIQSREDNCREHYVEREDLKKLLKTINEILTLPKGEEFVTKLDGKEAFNLKKGKELLPIMDGSFFGGLDYGRWYYEDLIFTKKQIEKILNNLDKYKGVDFYYQSSW